MWFGDDSSKPAVSTLSGGGSAVCYGRAGVQLYADARGMAIPGREVRGRTGLYKAGLDGWVASVCLGSDWVTPQTCTGLLTTTFAVPDAVLSAGSIPVGSCHRHVDDVSAVLTVFFFSPGYNVDCVSCGLVLLSCGVVEYHVQQIACGGPGGCLPHSFHPATGNVLGLALDLGSDRLYDLVKDIPDVMGLRPIAAIVKVMSVPDSLCVRIVTPDDHVNIGFHEVLIHDLEDEELLFITLSELGCLRLD